MTRVDAAAQTFGPHLRALRLKRGLTQQALGDRAGLPFTHISSMERGLMVPNLVTLLRLARALECRPSRLIAVFDDADLELLLSN